MQAGAGANAIEVVGAPQATVNGIPGGGAVHVWTNNAYAQRLIGEPTSNTRVTSVLNGGFGSSVDVAAGVIVVGAPYEDGAPLAGGYRSLSSARLSGDQVGFGAAYVFERNSDGAWARVAKLTVGENAAFTDPTTQDAPSNFGEHVAVSDDGGTIVVSQVSAPQTGTDHNWGASAHVFVKPTGGWTDMNTNHANVTSLRYDSNGATPDTADTINDRSEAYGDVDIAGDGSVVAVGGSRLPRTSNWGDATGAVLVFNRPGSAWTDGSDRLLEQNAVLAATDHEANNVRVGNDIAVNQAGDVIASNGAPDDMVVRGYPGSAFVWTRSGASWTDTNSPDAVLSDSTANNGDNFGSAVAISDSGDRVAVSDGYSSFTGGSGGVHIFNKPGSWVGFLTTSSVIASYPLQYARNLALDGETTLLVGTPVSGEGATRVSLDASPIRALPRNPNCPTVKSNDVVTHTCTLLFTFESGITITNSTLPAITIPEGLPDGSLTITGSVTIDGAQYTDSIELEVRAVDEVAEVTLDFATDPGPFTSSDDTSDDKPYPSSIAAGEATRLRLSILNENGEASGRDDEDGVASILFTTNAGTFSPHIFRYSDSSSRPVDSVSLHTSLNSYNPSGCESGDGGQTCSVLLRLLSASNADRIVITLAHPGADKAGATTVRATVITNDGESFTPPPLTVTFEGDAETLAISEPTAGLLAHATAEDGDNRDTLKLIVSAADTAGNDVEIPYRAPRATITGPDDKTVTSGLSVIWTEDGDDADNDHDRFTRNADAAVQATITVAAPATAPLATGEYTLELRTDGKTASQTFTVIGAVDSVTLGEPSGSPWVNGRVSLTATVRDAGGTPVPDGTPIEWSSQNVGDSTVLVQLSVDRVTTGGTATAEYIAVNAGTAAVKASAGDLADVALVSIAAESPAPTGSGPEPRLSDGLTSRSPGSYTVWAGSTETTASALLAELSGVSAISHTDGTWLPYAGAGSTDFTIRRGAVLWLAAE